jgi:hypothetical protein
MHKGLLLLLLSFSCFSVYSQKKNAAYEIHIQRAHCPMRMDGVLDEPAWGRAEVADSFFMVLPMDTSRAQVKTEVRMTYDSRFMYLSAVCYDAVAGPYMVESLRRDWNFVKNDNFIFFMDPFDDQTNGFTFGTNAAGGQWDGMMYEGGKVDLSWDNKWISKVKRYPDRWILEMAVPFKTLRYKKGITRWGINFSRNDLKTTEKSSWTPIPRQFPTASLAYTGVLVWDTVPPLPGTNISLIPYLLTQVDKSYDPAAKGGYKTRVGGDAKIALTSSLNLDLTINPDFSQVEVDKQLINLSQYELFYPEKRQFFLENGDQFANFGYADLRPFFSRRIGLGVPIEFGGRLSGKLDRNWRIGAMDMQTGSVDSLGLPRQNFAVLALQRKVFARSNIGFLFVNKESLGYQPGKDSTLPQYSAYNRNFGLEYNLASANNFWTGKMLLLKSFSPGKSGHDWVQAGNLQFSNRHWLINGAYEYSGRYFVAETGYVQRQGYIKLNPQVNYLFFPAGGPVLSHGPQFLSTYYYDEKFHQTDHENMLTWLVTFRNRATLAPVVIQDYVKLLQPFDPTHTGIDSLNTGTEHHWYTAGLDFVSKPQSVFTYDFSLRLGGFYDEGTRLTFSNDIGYRFQPYVSIALSTSYNVLRLPQPWGNTTFWLIGPRFDVTMTNTLFFTAFIQYNQQIRNMNINTRLQWRYKPASDLFIVYTDNYYSTPFSVRNRAVVLKFTYWWNI